MHHFTLRSTALALLVSASPVIAAQPGTGEEAHAVQKRLERYVGKAAFAERYVTIVPNAGGYRVAMDLSPLMSRLGETGVSMEISPFEFQMSRRPDGDWNVGGNYPERLRLVAPVGKGGERVEIDMRTNDGRYDGVVADRTGTFLSSSGQIASMEMRQEDGTSITQSTVGTSEFQSQARDSAPGLVDFSITQTIGPSREVVTLKPEVPTSGEAGDTTAVNPFEIGPTTTTVGDTVVDATISGMRVEAAQELWALGVQRLEAADGGGDALRDQLRTALRALGPVWDDFRSSYSVNDLKVEAGFGSATLARFEQTMSSDGFVRAGDHRITMAIEGLDVVSDLLPPVARDLMPQTAKLVFAATGVDLETPKRLLSDNIDPGLENLLPQETGEALLASLLEQPPRLVVEPSRIAGPGYDVTFDLVAHSSEDGYRVIANVAATGIDGVMSKLQAMGTPEAFQAAGMLGLAKGFGRPEADGRTVWTVERPSDGSVKVNGVELVPPPSATP